MSRLSGLRNDWRIFRQTLRTSTVLGTLIDTKEYYRVKRFEKVERFDQTYGVETSRMIGLEDLGGVGPHLEEASHYWPTRQCEFDRMMSSVGPLPHPEYCFVDLGCGLGRVVLLAAAKPFKGVVGIDFSPGFIAQAKENIKRYTGPVQCGDIELLAMDAVDLEFPPDNLLVYMFSPFSPPVFDIVMENLMASARQRRQTVKIVYYSPDHEDVVRQVGFELVGQGRGDHWPWHIYSTPPWPHPPQ